MSARNGILVPKLLHRMTSWTWCTRSHAKVRWCILWYIIFLLADQEAKSNIPENGIHSNRKQFQEEVHQAYHIMQMLCMNPVRRASPITKVPAWALSCMPERLTCSNASVAIYELMQHRKCLRRCILCTRFSILSSCV